MRSRGPSRDSLTRPVWWILMLTVLALIGACSAGPSSRPAIIVKDGHGQSQQAPGQLGTTSLPPLVLPGPSTVGWGQCDEPIQARLATVARPAWLRFECGQVSNMLDSPDMPRHSIVRLAVLRAGTGKIPILVVNDVSGEPGTIHAARLAAWMPPEFLTQFSLIGLDRRGTGSSEPVRCLPQEVRLAIVHADPAAEDVSDLLEHARKAGQQCVINLEGQLSAMDTWRTSADLERVRKALGLGRLHAIGVGEGSRVLSTFADRLPGAVGRMVLDGVPDPTQNSLVSLADVAAGAEAAFDAFATDCLARGCQLGPDPKQALMRLLDELRAHPLRTADDGELSAGAALRAVQLGLADRPQWSALEDAISKARSGNGGALLAMLRPLIEDSREYPTRLDISLVTGCNDTKDRLSLEPMANASKQWRDRFPLFGGLLAQQLVLCSAWPVASNPPQPLTAKGTPPILVVSTTGDPLTPEQGTEHAAQQLNSAVRISWVGAGHGALTRSPCVNAAALDFLTNGKIPTAGTTCPP